jgi:hypothetical protein
MADTGRAVILTLAFAILALGAASAARSRLSCRRKWSGRRRGVSTWPRAVPSPSWRGTSFPSTTARSWPPRAPYPAFWTEPSRWPASNRGRWTRSRNSTACASWRSTRGSVRWMCCGSESLPGRISSSPARPPASDPLFRAPSSAGRRSAFDPSSWRGTSRMARRRSGPTPSSSASSTKRPTRRSRWSAASWTPASSGRASSPRTCATTPSGTTSRTGRARARCWPPWFPTTPRRPRSRRPTRARSSP